MTILYNGAISRVCTRVDCCITCAQEAGAGGVFGVAIWAAALFAHIMENTR